jgi:tetratricopeptide (TPR) repeat protein
MKFLNKHIIFFVLLFLLCTIVVSGQNKETFEDAISYYDSEDYVKAFTNFQKILNKDPDNCNINYLAGQCLYNQPQKKKEALIYFEKASKSVSKSYKEASYNEVNAPIDALLLYAQTLQLENRLNDAKNYYSQYQSQLDSKDVAQKKLVEQKIKSCDVAEEMLKLPVYYSSQILPEPIKSNASDYKAVFNSDETAMVFESDRKGKPGLYFSQFKNNEWTNPIDITRDLDIDLSFDKFSLCSMSADGKRLYLVISDEFETLMYVSTLGTRKWEKTKPLNKNINSRYSQTFASESPDGRQLYFTSDRKGSIGGLDIYVSLKNEKNDWGDAINLGENVNTPFNEETPFVSTDNNTLYFSSEGHNSMGGYDIFFSKKISDLEWTMPENIGYPINTTADNMFFVPSREVNKGYYVLDPEKEPHIALVDLNKKVEEPVAEPEEVIKEELIAAAEATPIVDTVTIKEEPPIEIPKENLEEKLHNITGTFLFSDNSSSIDNAIINIKSSSGESITSVKPSYSGSFQTQLKYGSYIFEFSNPGYKSIEKPIDIALDNLSDITIDGVLTPEEIKVEKEIVAEPVIAEEVVKEVETPKQVIAPVITDVANQFTIQIAAYNKEIDLSTFKNIDGVEYIACVDGLVRYHWGHFNTKAEALSMLSSVVRKGYKDAFVVPFSKYSGDTNSKPASGYTVQVLASHEEVDVSKFKLLRGVRMVVGNDNYIRYTSGNFDDYHDACQYLKEVVANGYSDAFIRRFNDIAQ